MVWPDAITMAIKNILSAPFLSEEQKKDIFSKAKTTGYKQI